MMAVDVNAQLPLVQDPELTRYVSSLGNTLAKVSERPGLEYRFYVINSPTVNAFALPGGHIYLTRGLIEHTRSGSELAAALAHEIGHVAERHGVDKMERQLRTGSLVSVLYNMILGGEPDLLRREALELGGALWSARHSRQAEEEADEKAIEYLLRSGLDPESMVSLLRKLVAVEAANGNQLDSWFSTHPLTTERITQAEAEIERTRQQVPPSQEEAMTLLSRQLGSYPAFLERLAELPGPSLLR